MKKYLVLLLLCLCSVAAFTGVAEEPGDASQPIVYFSYDSAKIRSSEMAKVEAIAAYLKAFPSTNVTIEGHTDSHGPDSYNMSLSKRRANAVKSALRRAGVDAGRMTVKAIGAEQLAIYGVGETCDKLNRRVEVIPTY